MRVAVALPLAVAAALVPAGAGARASDTTPPVVESVRCECWQPYQYSTVQFTAAAHDDESGIASVSWLFSDGVTASGATVTRELRTAGVVKAMVTVTDGAGNASTGSATINVLPNPFPPEPTYSQPTLHHVRLRPGTLSAYGDTAATPRRARLSFRLADVWDTTRIRLVIRPVEGHRSARRVVEDVREGERHLVLSTRRNGLLLPPGRYRVVVRAANSYGSDRAVTRLRIVP
ncbi:hypothetical protein SAMN04489844_0334 [Nocardioides exalbidus]|uniref:PKD domain-containing protein n=1 Tax=Nocardioides exalbidus TaxID=402596 RepID=A0A1H4JXG4_9ACTN|nr:PKD domain-containing protein [Nocardioides exalbidus]SEB50696.1 hypothetical protein SAMN04489844_0334 [Nocardioides exalbidus]